MSVKEVEVSTQELVESGVIHAKLSRQDDWNAFAESWSNLRPDRYMADGGKYRLRRYSEFFVDGRTGRAELRPHIAYRQETDVNHLNGGIDRLYEPLEPEVVASNSLAEAFVTAARYLESVRPGKRWVAQCFQNRILSKPNEMGQPAPEGIHRDGVDFVLTLFVGRIGVQGGISSVYAAENKTLLREAELADPGEYLFVDDHKLLHDVSGLVLEAGHQAGHRDVLIAMFTASGE